MPNGASRKFRQVGCALYSAPQPSYLPRPICLTANIARWLHKSVTSVRGELRPEPCHVEKSLALFVVVGSLGPTQAFFRAVLIFGWDWHDAEPSIINHIIFSVISNAQHRREFRAARPLAPRPQRNRGLRTPVSRLLSLKRREQAPAGSSQSPKSPGPVGATPSEGEITPTGRSQPPKAGCVGRSVLMHRGSEISSASRTQ